MSPVESMRCVWGAERNDQCGETVYGSTIMCDRHQQQATAMLCRHIDKMGRQTEEMYRDAKWIEVKDGDRWTHEQIEEMKNRAATNAFNLIHGRQP